MSLTNPFNFHVIWNCDIRHIKNTDWFLVHIRLSPLVCPIWPAGCPSLPQLLFFLEVNLCRELATQKSLLGNARYWHHNLESLMSNSFCLSYTKRRISLSRPNWKHSISFCLSSLHYSRVLCEWQIPGKTLSRWGCNTYACVCMNTRLFRETFEVLVLLYKTCDLSLRCSPLHKRRGVEYSALRWGCLISSIYVQLS